jgi:transposase
MKTPSYPDLPLLGVDISKAKFDVRLVPLQGSTHASKFTNEPKGFALLDTWLTSHQVSCAYAGLEATGPYGHALLVHLHARGHKVCLLNPRRVKDFAKSQGRRVKTDRVDASVIAAFLRAINPLCWTPAPQSAQDLQSLVRRRAQVMNMLLAERRRQETPGAAAVVASLLRQIELLKKELAVITQAIKQHILQHMDLQKDERLLRTIPGFGQLVSATTLAEIPNIRSFQRARDVAAFAGLTPTLAESGSSVRKRGGMTGEGNGLLRQMLYMAALQAVKRPTNAFHPAYKAMVARGKSSKCALGALMHRLVRVAFGVLKHNTPFAPNLAKLPDS